LSFCFVIRETSPHETLTEQRAAHDVDKRKSFVINALIGTRFRAQAQSDWMPITLNEKDRAI